MTDIPPAATADPTDEFTDAALQALTKVLEGANVSELADAQRILVQRMAVSAGLFPSRIPAPRNITEVGGYLNLIEADPVLYQQALASALGIAGPNPPPGFVEVGPPLFFAARANDRPAGDAQPQIPVDISVRSDFADEFDLARSTIADLGGTLPLLSPPAGLPPLGADVPDGVGLLNLVGRVLRLVPGTLLVDATTDPILVAEPDGGGDPAVLARQVNPSAPRAGEVVEADWQATVCDDAACQQVPITAKLIPLDPELANAGWHRTDHTAPTTSLNRGSWGTWLNITGLVAGETRLGDELDLLYRTADINNSSVRAIVDHIWDGDDFAGS